MHTVERLFDFDNNAHFIIALPFSEFDYWHQLCKNHNFELSHQLSKGGVNRFSGSTPSFGISREKCFQSRSKLPLQESDCKNIQL